MNEKEQLKEQIKELQRKLAKMEKEPLLTEKERIYLGAVIKPFRDRIKYISKRHSIIGKYIYIRFNGMRGEFIGLPYFEDDAIYKGMKTGKEYTLKELRLDEDIESPKSEKQKIYDQLKKYAEEHNTEPIDWADSEQDKFYIYYNCISNSFEIEYMSLVKDMGQIYFTSNELCKQAIEDIGKENIMKLFED